MTSTTAIIFLESLVFLQIVFCLSMLLLCVWADYFANMTSRRQSAPELTELFVAAGAALVIVGWSSDPMIVVRETFVRTLAPVSAGICKIERQAHKLIARHKVRRSAASRACASSARSGHYLLTNRT